MSTELLLLRGRRENIDKEKRDVYYSSAEMNVISFSGGATLGAMIQLSIGSDHIQLTKEDTKRLVHALTDWL